jgi:hypothetical protein
MVKLWEILQKINLWYNLSQLSLFDTFLFEICKLRHTLSDSHKSNKDQNKELKKLINL